MAAVLVHVAILVSFFMRVALYPSSCCCCRCWQMGKDPDVRLEALFVLGDTMAKEVLMLVMFVWVVGGGASCSGLACLLVVEFLAEKVRF